MSTTAGTTNGNMSGIYQRIESMRIHRINQCRKRLRLYDEGSYLEFIFRVPQLRKMVEKDKSVLNSDKMKELIEYHKEHTEHMLEKAEDKKKWLSSEEIQGYMKRNGFSFGKEHVRTRVFHA